MLNCCSVADTLLNFLTNTSTKLNECLSQEYFSIFTDKEITKLGSQAMYIVNIIIFIILKDRGLIDMISFTAFVYFLSFGKVENKIDLKTRKTREREARIRLMKHSPLRVPLAEEFS